MLVFEIEYEDSFDKKDIKTVREYALSSSIEIVFNEYKGFCLQYEYDLKVIREILTIGRTLD